MFNIILSIILIQCVLAKPFQDKCEIFRDGNLKFTKQNNGDLVWSKQIVNSQNLIDICLNKTSSVNIKVIIQIVDKNNDKVLAKKDFKKYQYDERCVQFVNFNDDHNEMLLKITTNQQATIIGYIKICQSSTSAFIPLDVWPPPEITTTSTIIPLDTWTPPLLPPPSTTTTTTVIPPDTWTPPLLPPSTTTTTTTIISSDTWTPPLLPPSTTTTTIISPDTWTPPLLPPSTTTTTTTIIPPDTWTPPLLPPFTTTTTTTVIPPNTWTPPLLPPPTTTTTTTVIPPDTWTPPNVPPSTTTTSTTSGWPPPFP